MIGMKYTEIIKANKQLENTNSDKYNIAILSNIMMHQSKDILEYMLRKEGINAEVALGNYDNIVQDSLKYQNLNCILIFWELCNIIDGLYYKIELLSEIEFCELIKKTKNEISIVLNNLSNTSLVIMNKFSSILFNEYSLNANRIDILTKDLNEFLSSYKNIHLVDVDKVVFLKSIDSCIDLRYFYSSKTLYTIDFFKTYFDYIKPIFLSTNGRAKKVLVFDCDNTLWKGILGEDGFEKIKIFKEIQYMALQLSNMGVVLCLCSKNNLEDVDEVLCNHPDMVLRDENIVIKKINWNDKASNIISIAKELNIGLDSFVFVDDSDFEIELIKEKLPMVQVFKVPSSEYEYGLMLRKISTLFYSISQTKEDFEKIKIYKAQIERNKEKLNSTSIEDYLKSLELNIKFYADDIKAVGRISQMTQKTNQFNLTTKRYTENDIENFIKDEHFTVLSIGVADKFGDNGIVGLAIMKYENNIAAIDTLLMSCRVLGRNIEYKFMDIIMDFLKDKGVLQVKSMYLKTFKNEQVSDFYTKCGFELIKQDGGNCFYNIVLKDYKSKNLDYIKVCYER